GHVDLNATSFGGYWTHLGPSNWYIDAVLQGTYFQTAANSIRGFANNFSGGGFAASIEGGYPIPLMSWLTFEPQVQGIWQRTSFDDSLGEGFSTITYDRSNVLTGRVGALLRGTFGGPGAVWQPYLKGNVWWGSNGFDTVRFDNFPIQTGRNGGTMLEGGGGVTGKLARNVSVYGDASYLESVSGEQRINLKGNVGMRVTWESSRLCNCHLARSGANVASWHSCDIAGSRMDFRFLRKSGRADITAMTETDPQPPTTKGAPPRRGTPLPSARSSLTRARTFHTQSPSGAAGNFGSSSASSQPIS